MTLAQAENMIIGITALVATGVLKDLHASHVLQKCRDENIPPTIPEYNSLTLRITGLAGFVAFCALIFKNYGLMFGALVVSVIGCLPEMIQSVKGIPIMKEAGWDILQMLRFTPVWIWGRILLIGVGRWTKTVFYFTLIGIPFYHFFEHGSDMLEDRREQKRLQYEYETGMEYIDRQAERYKAYQKLTEGR